MDLENHSHIWWLWSRVTNPSHSASLTRRFRHSTTLHHTSLSRHTLDIEIRQFTASMSLLKLDPFNILLVLNLFFHILISLEKFIVLGFTELQSLIEVTLKLLFKGIHLVLLLLNQLGLGGDDLFVSQLHIFFSFLYFEILACSLDLMSLGIFFLFSEIRLDLLLIQKFGAKFECQRKVLFQSWPICLNLLSMSIFKLTECLSILFLGLKEIFVPLLVEFLVLFDMSLLTFLFLLGLVENEFLILPVVILKF